MTHSWSLEGAERGLDRASVVAEYVEEDGQWRPGGGGGVPLRGGVPGAPALQSEARLRAQGRPHLRHEGGVWRYEERIDGMSVCTHAADHPAEEGDADA